MTSTHSSRDGTTPRRRVPGPHPGPGRAVVVVLLLLLAVPLLPGVTYRSVEEALALAYPGAEAVAVTPELTREQAQAVMAASQPQARGKLGGTWLAHRDGAAVGVAYVDHVIGRTEYITYLCALDAAGAVARIEILTYREPYGDEIKAREWLERFAGRAHGEELRLNREIPNIAGATLSCQAVVERVRFLLAFHQLVVAAQVPGWLPAAETTEAAAPEDQDQGVSRAAVIGEPTLQLRVAGAQAAPVADAALAAAATLDAELNAWRPDSGLNRLIAAGGGEVHPRLATVLERAAGLHRATDGAFDPTLKPVLELWARCVEAGREPTAAELAAARAGTGFERLDWDPAARRLTLVPGTTLDLSALHKGAVVDAAAAVIAAAGRSGSVDFGGSSWAAVGTPLPVVLRDPLDPEIEWTAFELPAGTALAVSASTGRRWVLDGQPVSHLLDARDGRPVPVGRAAAVVAPDALTADGLATACCLLEAAAARALVEATPGAGALLRAADGGSIACGAWPGAGP